MTAADFASSMPDDVAERLADLLLTDVGADAPVGGACSVCGQAAHVLVGGRCVACWEDENDESTPPVKRVSPDTEEREVA